MAGRGIALSYDRVAGGLKARRPDVHAGGRFNGRWRFNPVAGHGIALSYDPAVSDAQAEVPVPAETAPVPAEAPRSAAARLAMVRVLCSCGEVFAFDGDEVGVCPGCGRPAEWPTMGEIEREMRSDLEELLGAHEHGADPD